MDHRAASPLVMTVTEGGVFGFGMRPRVVSLSYEAKPRDRLTPEVTWCRKVGLVVTVKAVFSRWR